jgi:hypothetical protein
MTIPASWSSSLVGLKGKCLALAQKRRWPAVEHGGIFNAEILEATEQDEQQNLWVPEVYPDAYSHGSGGAA